MPRIFTPPDIEFDRSVPKVFIRNCYWTPEEIVNILDNLSDKNYDIYIYNDEMNDVQWAEGIRTSSTKTVDCRHFKDEDTLTWVKRLDDEFVV